MIAVFILALILLIYTTYAAIKASSLNLHLEYWAYVNTLIMNIYLVVPSFVAIYAGAAASEEGKKLSNLIGKYSNICQSDSNFLRVTKV